MWKSFFLYTRSEQRGIIVLLILILIVLLVRFSMPYWAPIFVASQGIDNDFLKEINELNAQINAQSKLKLRDSLFYFNPNKVTEEELTALGFSKYQRKSFLGYRSKVKNFTFDTELLKVYGMDSSLFANIQRYIVLDSTEMSSEIKVPTTTKSVEELQWINFNKVGADFWDKCIASDSTRVNIMRFVEQNRITKSLPLQRVNKYTDEQLYGWLLKNSRPGFKYEHDSDRANDRFNEHDSMRKGKSVVAAMPNPVIELNAADTAQLKLLHGIGSRLSMRIVNFRNSLGGFCHISQLSDVYGISTELFNNLQDKVTVDDALVIKIKPQKLSIKEISRHPYLNYNQAKELKNLYRKKKIPEAEDIIRLKSITAEDWEKIKPYLVIKE